MNKNELKKILTNLKIRTDAYYLNGGAPPDEIYVLEEIYGKWFVYYSEKGLRSGEREFNSEDAACRYLLERLKADPSAKM